MGLRIVLADDHVLVRHGLRALLEREGFEIVGEAGNGFEAVRLAEQHQPDVIVLDISMPTLNGMSALSEIARVAPRARTILVTMHTEEHFVLEALRAGAKGCVWKSQAPEHLVRAIRDVQAGGMYLGPTVSSAVVHAYLTKSDVPQSPLTDRERQVLQLVAEGRTSKEVAVILGVTVKTAETYRAKLMEKLDIHSAAGLVRYAIRRGFIEA